MRFRWQSLEMPLLARELKELAARPRTYIVRFAYAALLFIAACLARERQETQNEDN